MNERQVVFLAGSTRVLLGMAALLVLPAVHPGMAAHRLLFGGYIVFALVEQLAVLMVDLDGFKRINDEAGHLRGDELLQEISEELRRNTRRGNLVSRYGGDEFVVLLAETTAEHADVAAERLVACVREVGARFDPARPVSASVGLALARGGDTVAELLLRADRGAYDAKQRGGDRKVCAA